MCGRYNVTDDPALRALLELLGIDVGPLPTRYNIAPTDMVPAIHVAEGKVRLSEMRWWLVPHWSDGPGTEYAMFNARAENLEKSRAFQGPFRHRRALIPASSFIEWQKMPDDKQPWLIQPEEGAFSFAGVWDSWSDGVEHLLSCAIITVPASPSFRAIHNRMPLMLDASAAEAWLDGKQPLPEVRKLLQPQPRKVVALPVDRRINNARHKEPPRIVGDSQLLDLGEGSEPG